MSLEHTEHRRALQRLASLFLKIGQDELAKRVASYQGPMTELGFVLFVNDALEDLERLFVPPEPHAEFTSEQVTEAIMAPAAPMLEKMLETYRERRAVYGPSEQVFAETMLALFPHGLTLSTRTDWARYGLFHQLVGKLSRYAHDFFDPHVDSIHDLSVYGAMLEAEDRRAHGLAPFGSPK